MKLLFDANLSPIPRDVADSAIWRYAKDNGFDIITTDGDDFPPLTRRFGPPPKVILLESWRFPTKVAEQLIRSNAILIGEFSKGGEGLFVMRF